MMDTQIIDTSYRMIGFASYSWHFRISIDFLALFVSFVMAISYKYTTNLNKDYPSYLGMFIVNSMIAVIMFLASYFMHGASFDNDENFGIFGLFTGSHFSSFLQISIFIGFGMLWSYAMISNLFPDPLLPSLSALFEPIMSISIMDFIGLQQMPSGYTVMGYIFIIPGTFLILIGQNIYQKMKKN
jgi:hypothetical protein